MQSKSTFLEFLRGIQRYKFGPPKTFFRGEIIQGEWRNFHRARALFLTGVEFHVFALRLGVLPCLFAFSVLSLDCASLFVYVHQHDRQCFPMSTEETAVFDCICWLSSSRNRKGQSYPVEYCLESMEEYSECTIHKVNLNHGKEM